MQKTHRIKQFSFGIKPNPDETENYYCENRGRCGLICEKGVEEDA